MNILKSIGKAFESKTLWINVLTGVTTVAGVLPPTKGVLIGVTAVNFGLRLLTKGSVIVSNEPKITETVVTDDVVKIASIPNAQ